MSHSASFVRANYLEPELRDLLEIRIWSACFARPKEQVGLSE